MSSKVAISSSDINCGYLETKNSSADEIANVNFFTTTSYTCYKIQ